MVRRTIVEILAVGVFLIILLNLEALVVRLPSDTAANPAPGERIGVIHVHTSARDGGKPLADIVAIARKDHLTFLAPTDHNLVVQLPDAAADPPGFTLLAGEEVSTSSGHVLVLGVPQDWQAGPSYDRAVLRTAHASHGTTFIAHPFGTHPSWTDWGTNNFDGIEVWNEDAAWRANGAVRLVMSLAIYPTNTDLALARLARRPDESLAKWDQMLRERHVAGICGADAHGALWITKKFMIPFPGYEAAFNLARQHILVDPRAVNRGQADQDMLVSALREGHSYCALDALYPATGFRYTITGSGGAPSEQGDTREWAAGEELHISLPAGSSTPLIKVLRNGAEVAETQGRSLDEPLAGPGVYRTEVYL
ncbi:MAG: CehA/McbA family metallohydrolase, partial [Bryobacteraceae bacterium]